MGYLLRAGSAGRALKRRLLKRKRRLRGGEGRGCGCDAPAWAQPFEAGRFSRARLLRACGAGCAGVLDVCECVWGRSAEPGFGALLVVVRGTLLWSLSGVLWWCCGSRLRPP